MGKELAQLNKAWTVHQERNPNADYFSFISGWDAAAYDFIPGEDETPENADSEEKVDLAPRVGARIRTVPESPIKGETYWWNNREGILKNLTDSGHWYADLNPTNARLAEDVYLATDEFEVIG